MFISCRLRLFFTFLLPKWLIFIDFASLLNTKAHVGERTEGGGRRRKKKGRKKEKRNEQTESDRGENERKKVGEREECERNETDRKDDLFEGLHLPSDVKVNPTMPNTVRGLSSERCQAFAFCSGRR